MYTIVYCARSDMILYFILLIYIIWLSPNMHINSTMKIDRNNMKMD